MKNTNPPSFPDENGDADDFEFVVNFIDDGPADTTIRPPTPERVRAREADRENIERIVGWAKREQEKFNARQRSQPDGNDDIEIFEAGADTDDQQDLDKSA